MVKSGNGGCSSLSMSIFATEVEKIYKINKNLHVKTKCIDTFFNDTLLNFNLLDKRQTENLQYFTYFVKEGSRNCTGSLCALALAVMPLVFFLTSSKPTFCSRANEMDLPKPFNVIFLTSSETSCKNIRAKCIVNFALSKIKHQL